MADKIRKEIGIDEEKLKWIERKYGDVSLTWLFDVMLEGYIHAHEKGPKEYAELAGKLGDITSRG